MTTSAPSELLLKTLRHALRPFVRLLLANGVSFPQLAEMLKGVYVDLAEQDFPVTGKPQTASRISLLTGIHRKDVKRLRAELDNNEPMPAAVSLGMRLVNAWQSPPFADEEGTPKSLPRLARQGGGLSFDSLVAYVSKDIRARSVLDEWLRLGAVSVDENDCVNLLDDAFVPHQGFAEKAFFFGHNLHDHAAAAASNLIGDTQPFLERSVHYQRVPAALAASLAADAENGGMRLLKLLNRKVQSTAPPPADDTSARRFTFGIYFYADQSILPPDDVQ